METMLAQINVGDGLGRLQPINTPHGDGNSARTQANRSQCLAVATDQYPSRGWKLVPGSSVVHTLAVRCNRSIPLTGMETIITICATAPVHSWLQPINTPHGDGNRYQTCSPRRPDRQCCNRSIPLTGMETPHRQGPLLS